ncbi:MAG: hypothetical protein PHR06_06480 [Candidatus Cloacimonetes bacterium]|nr:hypothetical protein [Candidatus Cloacimonadota bacterium]
MVISRDLSFLQGVRKDEFAFSRKAKTEQPASPQETQTEDKEVRTETQTAKFSEIIVVVLPSSPFRPNRSLSKEKEERKESAEKEPEDAREELLDSFWNKKDRKPDTQPADLQQFQIQGRKSAISALQNMQNILSSVERKVDKLS